jgi:hypothetical protein
MQDDEYQLPLDEPKNGAASLSTQEEDLAAAFSVTMECQGTGKAVK